MPVFAFAFDEFCKVRIRITRMQIVTSFVTSLCVKKPLVLNSDLVYNIAFVSTFVTHLSCYYYSTLCHVINCNFI